VPIISIFVATLLAFFLTSQVYSTLVRGHSLKKSVTEVEEKLDKVKLEQAKLSADLDYYSDARNFEKRLRTLFNYRAPGEQMIIVVPPHSTTSTTSTEP